MTANEYVKQSRAKLRKEFGKVGLKTDCEYYSMEKRKNHCRVCKCDHDRGCLPCELGVCYFYSNKVEEKR